MNFLTRMAIGALVGLGACSSITGRSAARWTVSPSLADTVRTEVLAPGVRLHHLVRLTTPLRAHVLDIDLRSCVAMRAIKGGGTAVGRKTTTELLQSLPATERAIAAVNADFFLFAPPGVPVGAFVEEGHLLSGPIERPVLAFDDQGRPFIGRLTVQGTLTTSRVTIPVSSWNRPSPNAVGLVDAAWGQALDSLSRPGALALVPSDARAAAARRRYRVSALPVAHTGQALGDTLMLVGSARASVLVGDTVTVSLALAPLMPVNAVGGFPLLVRDSVIVPTVDTDGAVSFRGVNPRTAAGFAANGRRLLLVVIDGRQAGFSAGTTIRETAALLRDLGAREAVNLDGGGSTAMVVRDATTGQTRVVNKPSDATGERPVANALAVLGRCGRS
ncbi:MAG: phosphodiester glycosidase family protein [Gemmatimonadaceae bacterium]|nr:phosphodiester glycosidase family protein [Gemmatimonadaceae bacterium]MCC6430919.1 phosphodiester glycosidase family protein [Gemmatimonadaceae bacterium]